MWQSGDKAENRKERKIKVRRKKRGNDKKEGKHKEERKKIYRNRKVSHQINHICLSNKCLLQLVSRRVQLAKISMATPFKY